ncbi:restriction endonuclease subunit S [Latilactobacillus curvatus]|uniref:restriction endonuclease subunit S n=1 Tax=Latilactobacillus curvatus TaxID=28038 RepID=UPI0028B42920|nr:restriction endonuclease subunit S [Latilactobacillus curvatus]MDT7017075.1 restriction endonuclease subunit S [Latilactobacillus curvatus]
MAKIDDSVKKKVPELRFPGFADDWEERKLGEISKTTIGEFVIKTKQSDESPYPVYNGGRSYTGKYDEYNNDGPKIVISARGANAGFVNYVSGRYWAGNSCYSVSVTKEDEFSIGYLYQFIKYNQVLFTAYQQAANIPSVSKSDVEKFSIKYPTVLEQKKIESFFKQLDNTIALHQRKLDLLKEQKKGFLQKMFV